MKKGTFRKIVALGTGLTMLGATVFGATAAADLSQYPSPLFIQDGKFMGNIVVGKSASTEDVLGAIEIAASLQTAAVKKVAVPGAGGQTASVDVENVKIRQTGREFTLNSTIRDTFGAPIDFSDLPTLLADGEFDDNEGSNKETETYNQEIDFLTSTGRLEFREADDVYNDAADNYLWFDDAANQFAYVYELDFDTGITYDNASSTTAGNDLEDNVISIQGNKYTITDVSQTGGRISKMELLAGETVVWLQQGEPLTRTISGVEHTVILADVNEDEDKCGITVDGSTVWVDDGDTETINGVEVGVTDAIVVHSAGKDTDVCQVNVGATKITIEENKEVKKDDQDVDGSNARFRFENAGSSAVWDGFNLTLVPEDKVFLKGGDKWVDPVLENFQFDFAGMNAVNEEIMWTRAGRDATLEFNNYDGKPVKVEWEANESSAQVILGKDADQRLLLEGQAFDCGATAAACEDTQLFYVTSGHVVHILTINRIHNDSGVVKIDFDDETYGNSYDDKVFTTIDGNAYSVDLGSLGSASLAINDSNGVILASDLGDSNNAYTQYKSIVTLQPLPGQEADRARFNFGVNGSAGSGVICAGSAFACNSTYTNATFSIKEDTEQLETGVANNATWFVQGTIDTTDDEVDWAAPALYKSTSIWGSSVLQKDDDDNDNNLRATEWGSWAMWDVDESQGGSLWVPQDQAFANAFISKVGAVVSTGEGASALEFQQIQVGTAKLDSDISDVAAQNLLVVGGPCANSVAATLMGNPADCAEGFVDGEAIIQLWSQDNGNVALLVAGYSAADTRRASKVIANYKDYAAELKGDEVKVKGTTLSDITVSMVA